MKVGTRDVDAIYAADREVSSVHVEQNSLTGLWESGEGGGGLEWIPEGATVHIDFVNNRAWTIDDGVVAINTLLGEDETATAFDGASGYNAANLGVDGYTADGVAIALIGVAKTRSIDGGTFRLKWKNGSANNGYVLVFGNAAVTNSLFYTYSIGDSKILAESWFGYAAQSLGYDPTIGNVNVVALTALSGRSEFAVNGSSVVAGALTSDDWPAENYDVVYLDPDTGHILQTLTIYDALPDTTGLAALSEAA